MSATLEITPVELREAYLELGMGDGRPDPETLDALVRRLPQYAKELTDFAIDLVIVGYASEDETFVVPGGETLDAEAASALSVFQNALFIARNESAATGAVDKAAGVGAIGNPFGGLDRGGIRAIATGLKANAVFVGKLRDRIIQPETLSEGFTRRVSELLNSPLEQVAMHFRGTQAVAPAMQHFKADDKPVIGGKQTFEEALQTSGLDAEQQAYLRSL